MKSHWTYDWKVVFSSGKGTKCDHIVSEFGWEHVSAGDLMRTERASNSHNAQVRPSLP